MTRDSAYNAIRYAYGRIKGSAFSVEFESLDDFYNWSIESGWEYGKKLRRLNSNEGYSRDNCIWMDAEYVRRYDRRDYFSIDKWDETVARIRERLKNLPPYDPVKQQRNGREFFQYEHPDLEREGICDFAGYHLMATEKRLIELDGLINNIEWDNDLQKWALRGEPEDIPTVDAVEVPCKIGDSVWGIKIYNHGREAKKGVVHQMFFGEDMRLCICVKNVCRGEWGKNVFATKEETEAALARMDGDGNG